MAEAPSPPKLKPRFVVRLDDATFDALRRSAFEKRVPQAALVRLAVQQYLGLQPPA